MSLLLFIFLQTAPNCKSFYFYCIFSVGWRKFQSLFEDSNDIPNLKQVHSYFLAFYQFKNHKNWVDERGDRTSGRREWVMEGEGGARPHTKQGWVCLRIGLLFNVY